LYRMPHAQYLTYGSETIKKETKFYNVSNEICPMSFGFSMNNLLLFYLEHLFID
jgi:hypothetical protein